MSDTESSNGDWGPVYIQSVIERELLTDYIRSQNLDEVRVVWFSESRKSYFIGFLWVDSSNLRELQEKLGGVVGRWFKPVARETPEKQEWLLTPLDGKPEEFPDLPKGIQPC